MFDSKFLLFLIFAFSLLLKIFFHSQEPLVSTDGCLYVQLAQAWNESGNYEETIQHNWGNSWLPPLPLFLIKSLMVFGLSAQTAGFCWAFTLGAALAVVAYGIAFEVTQNKKIAVASAFLFALHPAVNEIGTEIQRDIFYLFFVGCSIWLACAAVRRKKWYLWSCAAIPCGAAVLCRYETFELFPLVILILFILTVMKRISWRKALANCAAFFLVCSVTVICLSTAMGTNRFLKESCGKYFITKRNTAFLQWKVEL